MNFVDVIWIVAGICLCVATCYTVVQWGQRFYVQRRGKGCRKRIVHEILDTAIEQRAQFQLDFDKEEFKRNNVSGLCVDLQENWLQLNLDNTVAHSIWLGEAVTVHLQVSFRHNPSYFQFRSRIVDVVRINNQFVLRLSIPPHLEPGEKRSTLRILPQHDRVLQMRLWILDDVTPLPTYEAEVPATNLEMRAPTEEDTEPPVQVLHLDNISAGGARVTIDGTALDVSLDTLAIEPMTRIMFMLMLHTAEDTPPLALWLTGNITSRVKNTSTNIALSMRFLQWATVQMSGRPIPWLPTADESGVAPLAAWVMRHHLEQSKKL